MPIAPSVPPATEPRRIGEAQYLVETYQDANATLEESLRLNRALGDNLGEATVLRHLGIMGWTIATYQAAITALPRALALYQDLGHSSWATSRRPRNH